MGKLVKCDALNCKDPFVTPETSYQIQVGKGTWGKDRESAVIDLCVKDFKQIESIAKLDFKAVKAFRSKADQKGVQ